MELIIYSLCKNSRCGLSWQSFWRRDARLVRRGRSCLIAAQAADTPQNGYQAYRKSNFRKVQ